VAHYRLYFLDAANNITHAVDVDCDTDEQALAAAQDQAQNGKIEIWRGKQKVGVCAAARPPVPDAVDELQSPSVQSGLNGQEAAG
jgi:hypothetical protein